MGIFVWSPYAAESAPNRTHEARLLFTDGERPQVEICLKEPVYFSLQSILSNGNTVFYTSFKLVLPQED